MSEIMKEFKLFREQVYQKFADYDRILRDLVNDKTVTLASTFDDETALKVKDLYPVWGPDITITQDDIASGKNRYQHDGKLYKCTQAHTTQADWTPDITPAMWTLIDVEHAGTLEDPIPAVAGMEYTKGLYYIEGTDIYLMNRAGMEDGEKITLQYLPSEMVGLYFEKVE